MSTATASKAKAIPTDSLFNKWVIANTLWIIDQRDLVPTWESRHYMEQCRHARAIRDRMVALKLEAIHSANTGLIAILIGVNESAVFRIIRAEDATNVPLAPYELDAEDRP